MANINIFALGGQDENGKNSIVLEVENDIYLINYGIKIPINNNNGIDGIIADTEYLIKRKKRIKGVFITNISDEAFAGIPWLIMDIKGLTIYGSAFVIEAVKERVSKYNIGHNEYSFKVINQKIKVGNIDVKVYEAASSAPGTLVYSFLTSDGAIKVVSSSTIDSLDEFGNTDLNKISEDETLALLMDSSRANFPGKASEHKSIKKIIEPNFEKAKPNERIIVTAYDENMFLIKEIIQEANKYNRPVILYGRAYAILLKRAVTLFNIQMPMTVDYRKSNHTDNAVILITGTWSRLYQRIVRIATGNDIYLKLRHSDHFIMAAPPVNGMEVEQSVALDEVAKITGDIIDISEKDFYPLKPAKEDIQDFVKAIKPKFFLPISSLYRYMVEASKQAISQGITQDRNVILKNGYILYLKDKELASQKGKIDSYGEILIDGYGAGDVSFAVVRERVVLAAGGLITIAFALSRKTKKPIGNINVQFVGVATKGELKELTEKVQGVVIQKLEELEKWDYREAQNIIRKRVRKVVSKTTNKEPLVVTSFFEM